MLQKPPASKTIAQLILANADERSEAPVGEGYYMIGRDAECQIRPHSSSISKRHCLLEHRVGMLRVFDLESTAGTFVNDQRLVPHRWHFLKDGDKLRCGKVMFAISLKANPNFIPPNTTEAVESPQPSKLAVDPGNSKVDSDKPSSTTKESPDFSDESFDIDEFVDFQDDQESSGPEKLTLGNQDSTNDSDADVSFEDFSEDAGDTASEATVSSESTVEESTTKKPKKPATVPKKSTWGKRKSDVPKPKRPKKQKVPKAPRAARSISAPSFSFNDPEKLKLIGAIVLTFAILGLFGYQLKQFMSPQQSRVIQDSYAVTE